MPLSIVLATVAARALAQPPADLYQPQIAPASKEAELAIHGFDVPAGMTAGLVAAEPLLANPVAFSIDERGRFFVCETFRQQKGVEDNRNHMHWLHDDLAARTVADRLAYFQKHLGERVQEYAREHDRLRLLEDTDGDGRADRATVFADGFNDILDGAGVLAWRGDVYYTCIPKLYRMRDWTGDGVADNREVLSEGYGVRVAFRGHDLHGLVMGPDRKLYFSVGDRGYNVVTQEGVRLIRPDSGAVFRCEPDGSQLEVFCHGLRNPQELAFDDYGNLFTVDNNSDSGDEARLLYLVEGADYGWRMYYQYLEDRGPWNRERMWRPRDDDETRRLQPAYILPPIANLSDGPSGLVHYPGVGLPERYRDHFFLADFRGTPANSGIRSFTVKPKGAGFELADSHQFIWKILATDVDFGYDGSLYVLDWVDGWEGIGKGRIYRFTHPEGAAAADEAGTEGIVRHGFGGRSNAELARLLEHADRRVRTAAQFELVDRQASETLLQVARSDAPRLARIHAIWALGQHQRRRSGTTIDEALTDLFFDIDPEIRLQTIRTFHEFELSDETARRASAAVRNMLNGHDLRAQFFATAWARSDRLSEKILANLALHGDKHPLLRHVGTLALQRMHDWRSLHGSGFGAFLTRFRQHNSPHVRRAIVVALRRMIDADMRSRDYDPVFQDPIAPREELVEAIVGYLRDSDGDVVLEAARAIDDLPIEAATRDLAALAADGRFSDALLRRVMNANFRRGRPENARPIAAVAANAEVSESLRLEALEELRLWNELPPLDRVTGAWRPIERQQLPRDELADAVRPHLAGIFSGPPAVRRAAARMTATHALREAAPVLFALISDPAEGEAIRVQALQALDTMQHDRLESAMQMAIDSGEPLLRAAGRRVLARLHPSRAVAALKDAVERGTTPERQQAIDVLATLATLAADAVLLQWLEKLIARNVPDEIQLDLLLAAQRRGTDAMQKAIARFEAARRADDHLAAYREALAGGSAERGREIFYGRSEVSCRRCHKIDGDGGEAGPDLSSIGRDKTREYLLESLIDPNRQIAKGYNTVVLAMLDGKVYTGVVKSDDGEHLRLMTAEGATIVVPKDEIDDRAEGKSGMPADLVKHLSKSDVRDLVEFLNTLSK